jgi:hypothetical protein
MSLGCDSAWFAARIPEATFYPATSPVRSWPFSDARAIKRLELNSFSSLSSIPSSHPRRKWPPTECRTFRGTHWSHMHTDLLPMLRQFPAAGPMEVTVTM